MIRQVKRARRVADDLIAIYLHIHRDSPSSAERVLDAIERSIRGLLATPGLGRRWESSDSRLETMRVFPVTPYRNYLIFYRPIALGIEVFRVIHGARELDRIIDDILADLEND